MGCLFSKKKKLRQPLFYKLSDELFHKYFSQDILTEIILNYEKEYFNIILSKNLVENYIFKDLIFNSHINVINIQYFMYISLNYNSGIYYLVFFKDSHFPTFNDKLLNLNYDYDKIKEIKMELNKQFIKYYYHPKRIAKWEKELDE
jgi:hypothetical protein